MVRRNAGEGPGSRAAAVHSLISSEQDTARPQVAGIGSVRSVRRVYAEFGDRAHARQIRRNRRWGMPF